MKIQTPVFLYRLYDSEERLLYVGITESVGQRMSVHKATQPWWGDVANIKVEMLEGDRASAEEVERLAILTEKPLRNRAKTQPPKPRTPLKTQPTPARRAPEPPKGAGIEVNERGVIFVRDGKGITVTMARWPQTKSELFIARRSVPRFLWSDFKERMKSECRK